GNTVGTLAMVAGGLAILRRRPVDGVLLLGGVGLAAAGSAVASLGEAPTSLFVAAAAVMLYAGFMGVDRAGARLAGAAHGFVERTRGQRHGHGAGTS
ncbi:MAG: hypothetical protein ACE5EV_07625, partial [Gaiellales bacterium]